MDTSILRFLFKHSSIYGIGTIFGQAVGFFLLPIYTRYLSPSDYGVAALIETTLSMTGIILGLGVLNGMIRFYHDPSDEKGRNKIVSTTYWITFLLSTISIVIMLAVSDWIGDFIFKTRGYSLQIQIAALAFAVGLISDTGLLYWRIKEQSAIAVSVSVMNSLAMVGLNIYFLAVLKSGLIGIFYSMLISRIIFAVGLTAWILMRVGLGFSLRWAVDIVKFSFPFIFSHIFRVVTQESDKYFINFYFSTSETGVYAISQKFAAAIHLLITVPFLQSYVPKQYDIMKQNNAASTYALVLNYYLLVVVSCGLILAIFSRELLLIMATYQYYQSAVFIPLIVLSWITFGSKYNFEIGMLICKKTTYIAYINAASAITNVVLNFLLIPRLSIWGAVIALNLSCLLTSILNLCVSQRLYPIPFEWKFVFKLLTVSGLTFVFSEIVAPDHVFVAIVFKSCMLLVYIASLIFFNLLDKEKLRQYCKLIWNAVFSRAAA
jgi:O-antigen/teichoic acid export membrane protein